MFMSNLETALQGAAEDGIITETQAQTLFSYLGQRLAAAEPTAGGEQLLAKRRGDAANPLEDSEAPRFVRGFHDILITIGIIVALLGFGGVGSVYATLPAIIIFAEIFVRRQRLALPAVALTVATVLWIGASVMLLTTDPSLGLEQRYIHPYPSLGAFLLLVPFPPLLALFHWRYRVPIALAALLISLFLVFLAGVLAFMGPAAGWHDATGSIRYQTVSIFFVCVIFMFAVAMSFDLRDRERVTRSSDVAFWMHLATAPALLYGTVLLCFLLLGVTTNDVDNYTGPAVVVAIVLVMMAIGLIIDRRAFVTSGLLSLGVALSAILQHSNMRMDGLLSAELVTIGIFVLLIGMSWLPLRRAIVGRLPLGLQAKLPALR
jgi:hypothetical protein